MQRFVYTNYLALSHITIAGEETDVVLFGLYGMLAHGNLVDIELECDFAQFNDLLDKADYVPDETITRLAEIVAAGVTDPVTIEVMEHGGIHFSDLLFCLEEWSKGAAIVEDGGAGRAIYSLHAFIPKEVGVPAADTPIPANDPRAQLDYYASALIIQYLFYLHFMAEDIPEDMALQFTGLESPLVFMLAKTSYEIGKVNG